MSEIPTFPVQIPHCIPRDRARCPVVVVMAAYEVYSHVYSPQPALITGECRGGFGSDELIALLYARSFPKAEWRARVDEALEGMKNL